MKREHLVNLAIAAPFAALVAWVVMHTYWAEVTLPAPLQGEAASNPYYSVQRVAGTLGIRTRQIGSLRALPLDAVVWINNLHDDFNHERIESLQTWVEAGGRLMVSGDTLWARGSLQSWSGIAPSHRDPEAPVAARGRRLDLDPDENCTPMIVRDDGVAAKEPLHVCTPPAEFAFISKRVPAWSLSDAQGMQVLRVAIGRGEFIVFGAPWILNNRPLLLHDHLEVLIDAARLRSGDELLILNQSRPVPLPVLLWRLAAPAIVFFSVAVVFLILRYLPRFGPPVALLAPVRRSLGEQIRANARFALRTGKVESLLKFIPANKGTEHDR